MIRRASNILLGTMCLLVLFSCKTTDLDFNKLSKKVELPVNGEFPGAYGSYTIVDFIEDAKEDLDGIDVGVNENDLVYLYFRDDSVLTYDLSEFNDIPQQGPVVTDLVFDAGDSIPSGILSDTMWVMRDTLEYYGLKFNNMRIDSATLTEGTAKVAVINTLPHDLALNITSTHLVDEFGNDFDTTVYVPDAEHNTTGDSVFVDLTGYTLVTDVDDEGKVSINLVMAAILDIVGPNKRIDNGEGAFVTFEMQNVNEFEELYGWAGTQIKDTTLTLDDLGFDSPILDKFTGSIEFADPKINLIYDHSIGVQLGLDFQTSAYFEDELPVDLDTIRDLIPKADPVGSSLDGQVSYTKADGIDDIIRFPLPEVISLYGRVETNKDLSGAPADSSNWFTDESAMVISVEMELPMDISADLMVVDTMDINLGDRDDEGENNLEYDMEFVKLFTTYKNQLPFDIQASVVMLDTNRNVFYPSNASPDTIPLVAIEAAQVDGNGEVDMSKVKELEATTDLNADQTDFLLNEATKLITIYELNTTNNGAVKVKGSYTFDVKIGVGLKGSVITTLD